MKNITESWLLTTLVACLPLVLPSVLAEEKTGSCANEDAAMFVKPQTAKAAPAREDPDKIADFACKDPLGVEHKGTDLYGSTGMLVMLTVPNLTQYEKQQRWEKWVAKQKWPEHNAPQRVLIEDLSQQQTFKEKARAMMKQCYDKKGDVVVLVDEDGNVRRQFGVNQNETVIFLIDASGRIIHSESDDVEPDRISAQRLITHVRNLAENNIKAAATTSTALSMAR